MWVFNGDDFESHIKQYCNTEFEIKVVDSMCVKIITKLYSFSDILSYFPQNPFSESLVQFRQKELMEEYAAKENTIYENAQNMISKSFISFSSYLNFICYNVCSELDEIYFSCIQQCQNQTEIKEEIIIQSTTYFATLINGLNKTVNDIKSLGELYQKDLGKKAPVQDMCLKVSKCDQNTVQILKEYANIYEPYNFIFNQDAQSKYYGAIEANTNQSDKFAMILGNVFLKNENYLKIGENTVNHSLLSYILKFIKHEYNLPILQEQLQIREMILYSTLKLITIFVQVQKYTQENNDILEQLFNQFQIVMPDAQFKGIIQHVYTLKQNYSKHGCEYEAQINAKGFQEQNLTTSTQPEQKPEQKKEDQSEQRKRMLQRQQEVLKQMQSQQNKFKQLNVENASNQMQIEEECCFCKQPLTQSAYGVLVSIQKNTFYAEQEIKTLLRNLEQSKNDNLKSQQEELKQICLSEQRANGDMFVFSTCDHKIHKECYEQNINNIQLNQYEQASKDFEVKCQICKQYRNFFLEINHPTGFEDEKFENKAENANQNNGMPMMMEFNLGQDGFNDFDAGFNNFGANSMYNQGSSYNNYDFGGNLFGNNDNGMMGNNAFSMEPTNLSFDFNPSNNSNQMQLSKEEGDDDGEVKEIIYKKVKKNNSEAQFKESQQHSIQRIGKIYSMMQREKNGVSELRDILNQSLIQQQKQPPQADQQEIMRQKQFQESMLALSIFDKYIKVNDERQSQSTFNFSQIMQEPFDQFLFYEKCLYNQIRYFDLANKKPDDDTSLLKVSNFLLQCYLNSFSFINDSNKRQDIVQKRFKYCQQFDELLHKGVVAKYDETLFKDLPYILKKEYLENNIPDAYTSYLIFKLGFQFNANSEKIVQTSLPQVLKKFSLQIIRSQNLLAQSADKFSIDNEDNVDIIENYLLRLSRRSLITTILFKKYTEQNQTFNKIFASSSMYDAENSVILKYFNLSMKDYLPTQAEIDSLECTQKINKNQQSKILPLLLITEAHNFCFDLIPIPDDYLAYSKTLHMKKCSLCNKIPLITDLMQCLICGDLCCAQSCTQTVQRTAGSLNRHANICHGGQAIFVNTQSGYISVISSPHNTILVSTFIFQNSLKQPIRKQIRCDWKQFLLNKSLIQNLKKQLFENNTRNLVLEDHQQRIEKNIKPFIINPRIL